MEVRVQLSVTMEEGRLLYHAVAVTEALVRERGEECEDLVLMLGALKGFWREE